MTGLSTMSVLASSEWRRTGIRKTHSAEKIYGTIPPPKMLSTPA